MFPICSSSYNLSDRQSQPVTPQTNISNHDPEILFRGIASQINISNHNPQILVRWITAQINALSKSILINPRQIKQKSKGITNQFRYLVKLIENRLIKEENKNAETLLSQAYKELQYLENLIQGLPEFNVIEKDLRKKLINLTGDKPLLMLSNAEEALTIFRILTESVDPETPLNRLLMSSRVTLSGVFETWTDLLISSSKEEFERLSSWDTESAHGLVNSLKRQLKKLGSALKKLRKECINLGLADVVESLQNAECELSRLHFNMIKQPSNHKLLYGSKEWDDEMAKCPIPVKSFEEREWSDQTKSKICLLFSMSLFLQWFGFAYLDVTDPNRREHAEALQREMLEAVPDEMRDQIYVESTQLKSSLETYYSSKNALVKYNQDSDQEVCLLVEPYLNQVISHFGKDIPSQDDINQIVNDFMLRRYVQESPIAHPYKHMGIGQWWRSFTESRYKNNAHKAPSVVDHITNFATKAITSIGSWLGLVTQPNPSHQDFVKETSLVVRTEIEHALVKSRSLENALIDPRLLELRQEVNLLRQELLKSAYHPPADTSSLQHLANWRQNVHDTCYALESLEKSVAEKMNHARQLIRGDVSELESSGNKHKNIVLLDRLTTALNIPGVQVPAPAAITSPLIHEFLHTKVPEVFQIWKQLEEIYVSYEGDTPFFHTDIAKSYLQQIDDAIATAFSAKGAFDLLNPSKKVIHLLKEAKKEGDSLMVRSSGSEDSRKLANAGGNESSAYVSTKKKEFIEAVGISIRSNFSPKSLQIRHNEGENVFEQELQLSVTTQRVVGEPVGGASDPNDITISLVLFSNEPLYIGNEKWRIMQLNVGYGHGNSVVGNYGIGTDTVLLLVSEMHPDKLYILYDNREKLERLAPVRNSDGKVVLEKVANPPILHHKKILSDELLARLYHFGVIGESFFEDTGTDMEIVIKRGVIYPVQARPVNRPIILPTYIDLQKVAELENSPIIQAHESELIVLGKGSVVQISHPDAILTATTLEEAESLFNINKHKIVIIHEEEPANSHPTVNFKNKGIPCLLTKDQATLNEMISNVNENNPLFVCIQTGAIYLWNTQLAPIEAYISTGFTVFPGKVCQTISLSDYSPTIVKEGNSLKELKTMIRQIGSAISKEKALSHLHFFANSPWAQFVMDKGEFATEVLTSDKPLHGELRKRYIILQRYATTLHQAIEETRAAIVNANNKERLKQLLHLKNLEALVLGCSSVDALQIDKDIDKLNNYQELLTHSPHLMDLVLIGNHAISDQSGNEWFQFLATLEPYIENGTLSKSQLEPFRALLNILKSSHIISPWLTFYFRQALSRHEDPLAILNDLIQTLPTEDNDFVQQHLTVQQELQAFEQRISGFGDPAAFSQAWENAQSFMQAHANLLYDAKFPTDSPIPLMIAISTMKRFVDFYDLTIKEMISSHQFSEDTKVTHLKAMLDPFIMVLDRWIDLRIDHDTIPVNPDWPVKQYIDVLKEQYNATYFGYLKHLNPREEFDVSAAMLGTTTSFHRMFPSRLIEFFTLIHQDLLQVIGILNNNLVSTDLIQQSTLPDLMKHAMQAVSEVYPNRLSLHVEKDLVTVKYNVPLRNHSGQINLLYNTHTRQITMEGHFIGQARDRWKFISHMAQLLSEAEVLPLHAKPKLNDQTLSLKWSINNQEQLEETLSEYRAMAQYTMRDDIELYSRALVMRLKDSGKIGVIIKHINDLNFNSFDVYHGRLIHFIKYCVMEGIGYEEATNLAQSLMKKINFMDYSIILFSHLNEKQQAIDLAVSLGKAMVKSSNSAPRVKGISLLRQGPIQAGYFDEEILDIIKEAVNDPAIKVKVETVLLLMQLVRMGKGYEIAIHTVNEWFKTSDRTLKHYSVELVTELVRKNQAIEEATEIARLIQSDNDLSINGSALEQLLKHNV